MLCLCRDSELPELFIKVMHECGYLWLENTEVVILHLLSLRSAGTEKCTACKKKVQSVLVKILVDEEVLLL